MGFQVSYLLDFFRGIRILFALIFLFRPFFFLKISGVSSARDGFFLCCFLIWWIFLVWFPSSFILRLLSHCSSRKVFFVGFRERFSSWFFLSRGPCLCCFFSSFILSFHYLLLFEVVIVGSSSSEGFFARVSVPRECFSWGSCSGSSFCFSISSSSQNSCSSRNE